MNHLKRIFQIKDIRTLFGFYFNLVKFIDNSQSRNAKHGSSNINIENQNKLKYVKFIVTDANQFSRDVKSILIHWRKQRNDSPETRITKQAPTVKRLHSGAKKPTQEATETLNTFIEDMNNASYSFQDVNENVDSVDITNDDTQQLKQPATKKSKLNSGKSKRRDGKSVGRVFA